MSDPLLMGSPSLQFDGSNDSYAIRNDADSSSPAASTFLSVSAFTIFVAFRVAGITSTDPPATEPWYNDIIFTDTLQNIGIVLRRSASNPDYYVRGYNYSLSTDVIEFPILLNTNYVFMLRHENGLLSASLNGGAEVSIPSADTETLSGTLVIGKNPLLAGRLFNGRLGQITIYNVAVNATTAPTVSDVIANLIAKWLYGTGLAIAPSNYYHAMMG
jgi:hypothetical protein